MEGFHQIIAEERIHLFNVGIGRVHRSSLHRPPQQAGSGHRDQKFGRLPFCPAGRQNGVGFKVADQDHFTRGHFPYLHDAGPRA